MQVLASTYYPCTVLSSVGTNGDQNAFRLAKCYYCHKQELFIGAKFKVKKFIYAHSIKQRSKHHRINLECMFKA